MDESSQTIMSEPQKPSGVGFYILLSGVIILLAGLGAAVFLLLQSQNKISSLEQSLGDVNISQAGWEEEKTELLEQIDELKNQEPEFEGYGVIEKYESPLGFSFLYPLETRDERDHKIKPVVVLEEIENNVSYVRLVFEKDKNFELDYIWVLKKNPDLTTTDFLTSLQDNPDCKVQTREWPNGRLGYSFELQNLDDSATGLEVLEECKYPSWTFEIQDSNRFLTHMGVRHDAGYLIEDETGYALFSNSFREIKTADEN